VNTRLFLNEFKQRVIDNYIAEGLSFFENSSKCNLYQYIHAGHKMRQFHLNRPVNSLYKTSITRYIIISHVLNRESGRYSNIVRNERICTMYNKKSVEDEYHFILECDRYTDIRCKYIKKYYYRNPSTFKLIQ
jgi:hypothetical protein